MSLRFQAIGFSDVVDQASLARRLSHVVARARRSADGSLVFKPFADCEIKIAFSNGDLVERVEVCLDSPEQSILIADCQGGPEGCRVMGFSCVDGKPVSPFVFKALQKPEDLEVGDIWFVRLSAFADSLRSESKELAPSLRWDADASVHWASCPVLSARRGVNSITGEQVTVALLAAPGLVLWACTPICSANTPGEVASGRLEIFGEICSRAV